MSRSRLLTFAPVLAILLASCAPATRVPESTSQGGQPSAPRIERTMSIALELEPKYISPLAPTISAAAGNFFLRPWSAFLELIDDDGNPHPYLAEALPTLNTDTWKVFPDGKMETRYRLKPNLTWHDGKPLTAADFAFS
ncbi:MAG: Bacterial extracellular solute-binding protein, family 5 Middle, partial [Chloroflexi bacterium]|nr:Bacterial extracellular solute-binding protein, family 5 Middle [Chloroflexota bacterium]